MKKIYAILAIAAMLVTSCIYPFNPDIPEADGRMVIEGNILVGEYTTVKLSYVSNINGTSATDGHVPSGRAWVEDENGKTYEGVLNDPKVTNVFSIDTRSLDEGLKYRLHVVNNDNGKEYASLWTPVYDAGTIDGTGYNVDKEAGKLECTISMHNDSGVRNFLISYKEVWEYHSVYHIEYVYLRPKNYTLDESGKPIDQGKVEPAEEDRFYCWNSENSSDVILAGTDNLFADELRDFVFHKVDKTDRKISYIYSVDVNVTGLSGEALSYWKNIYNNSNISGSLFAPIPSEMIGNIRCLSDSTDVVLGYIVATKRVTGRMFYYDADERLYQDVRPSYRIFPRDLEEGEEMPSWPDLDSFDYAPYTYIEEELYWVPKRCVDCRFEGGVQVKPDYWPNED